MTSAAALVRAGLWSEADGGYQVHHYLDWNPSKAEVEKYRSEERARKKRPRGIQPPSALEALLETIPESDTASETRAGALSAPLRSAVSGPSGSGSGSSEGSLRETALVPAPLESFIVGNPHSRPTNLVNGSQNRIHGQHAWCSWPTRDGLCVLAFLHREFIGKLGGIPSADMELRAWYPSVLAKYQGVPVGDDALDFWRNEFREWVGTVTRKAHSGRESIGEQSVRAGREYLERQR
jgi:hypothetical protein